MATTSSQRRRRRKVDEQTTRAFTPPIARVIRRERARVASAGSQSQMVNAVRLSEWVKVLTTLWGSDLLVKVWDEQQKALGTSIEMPADVRKRLKQIATEHAKAITVTRKDRIRRRFEKSDIIEHQSIKFDHDEDPEQYEHHIFIPSERPPKRRSGIDVLPHPTVQGSSDTKVSDPLRAGRTFRSTQRKVLTELYSGVVDQAGATAFTEALQATETVRFESASATSDTASFRLKKVWFTQGDSLVRSSHSAVNGQSRFMRTARGHRVRSVFRVGSASLEHPRQPGGPPGEVINCRCFLEYRRVRAKK